MRGTATEPRIGPNAISRLADCLTREGRTGEAEAVFGAAGLRRYLDTPPGEMVPEADVVALYGALFATLGPVRAKAMARSAGAATARYLLAHRIPRLVQAVLRLSPRRWAARALCKAIAGHAWTFAGGGTFEWRVAERATLTILRSPLARAARGDLAGCGHPVCDFYAGTFEGVFSALVDRRARATEIACAAAGAGACVFDVDFAPASPRAVSGVPQSV